MTLLFNFGLMSLLLIVGHLLRSHVKLLQDYYIPSSMVAGFLAFVGGPKMLDWLPFRDPKELSTYPAMLVVILFATLFLGARTRAKPAGRMIFEVGDTFFYSLASQFGQYGLTLLFGLFVLAPLYPALNPAFALMLPVGFAGGPGTAAAAANGLAPYGWDEALTIGLTFATFGQLTGVVGGMILINFATRFGWSRSAPAAGELPSDLKDGFISRERQPSLGRETVNPLAIDPLAWHLAIVLGAVALGYSTRDLLKLAFPSYDFPVFALAMLTGALLQTLLDLAGYGDHVDRRVTTRIGSTASDYLIAFGICVIQPAVIGAYAVPVTVLLVFGTVYSVVIFWFIGRRIFHNYWFERSLFTFGWNTGLVGTGAALVRIVDPKQQSRTLEDYGLAYLFIASIEVALVVVLPPMIGTGNVLIPALTLTGMAVVMTICSAYFVGWFGPSATDLRSGEDSPA